MKLSSIVISCVKEYFLRIQCEITEFRFQIRESECKTRVQMAWSFFFFLKSQYFKARKLVCWVKQKYIDTVISVLNFLLSAGGKRACDPRIVEKRKKRKIKISPNICWNTSCYEETRKFAPTEVPEEQSLQSTVLTRRDVRI